VKTTLTGDYSHLKEAWDKSSDYISTNNLSKDEGLPILELYTKSMEQVTNPSKWVTEIYVPVKAKEVVVYKPRSAKIVPAVPAEASAEQPAP
jgi:predicted transcriptional regulator YdeE